MAHKVGKNDKYAFFMSRYCVVLLKFEDAGQEGFDCSSNASVQYFRFVCCTYTTSVMALSKVGTYRSYRVTGLVGPLDYLVT